MKSPNPYNYNLPVGPEMFFGRQGDVERMARHLMATPGDSFALIAGRRMGKTSLLEALLRSLEPQIVAPGGDVLPLPVFMDFSGAGVDSTPAFFQAVAAEAGDLLVDRLGLSLGDVPTPSEAGPPALAFRRALESWGRIVMGQRGRRPRLILLLDECEQIVQRPWSAELYGALRSLLVGHATRSLLKAVMTGSHRFLTQVRQRGSPLRNVLAYHMLYALDKRATQALITRPSGDALPAEIVQAIAAQSGGHPFLTQYLMRHLWERGLDGATQDAVREVAAAFPHERNDFVDWAMGLGEAGLEVYRALVQAGEALSEKQVRAILRPPLSNLPQALEGLCYHGLIVRDTDGRYRVAGTMFRDWFAANAATLSAGDVPLDFAPDALPLYRALVDRLDEEELRTLCFSLSVHYDHLRGESQGGKARELILYFQRRDDLSGLGKGLRRQRPDIEV
jgi:hypothetical protein